MRKLKNRLYMHMWDDALGDWSPIAVPEIVSQTPHQQREPGPQAMGNKSKKAVFMHGAIVLQTTNLRRG